MAGDDEIKGARDYRRYRYIALLNDLLRTSDSSGWTEIRKRLAERGWTDLYRLTVISASANGGGANIIMPDETVVWMSNDDRHYQVCPVQAYADWHSQFAEDLWDGVVWLRFSFKELRELTRAMRANEEPRWQRFNAFLEEEGQDPSSGVLSDLRPDQGCFTGEFVNSDRTRFVFDMAIGDAEGEVECWEEAPVDEDRFPRGYRSYRYACWLLDAQEGKTSDWIFTRPYKWRDNIKEGWNPPYWPFQYDRPEDAALEGFNRDLVNVALVEEVGENLVEVTLVTDRPSPGFVNPTTVACERQSNGRWIRKPPARREGG